MEWIRIALSALLLSSQIAVRVGAETNGSQLPPGCDHCTCYESLMDDEDCAMFRIGSASGSVPTENAITPKGGQKFCTNQQGQQERVFGICSVPAEPLTTPPPDTEVSPTAMVETPDTTTTRHQNPDPVETTQAPPPGTDKPAVTRKPAETTKAAEPTKEVKTEPTEEPKPVSTEEQKPVSTEETKTRPNGGGTDGQGGDDDGIDNEEKPADETSNAPLLAGVIAGCVVGSIVVGVVAALIVIKVSARFQGAYNTGEQSNAGSASEVFL